MSYDESDAQSDAMLEAASKALYPEHFERAIQEFTSERLQRFYMANRAVARAPLGALSKARALLPEHPEAAFVFAAIAAEVGLRHAVLRPITHGLVHNEDLADAVAELLTETRPSPSLTTLQKLSSRILDEYGGIDLEKDRRPGVAESLWSEMKGLNTLRNAVLHEAAPIDLGTAKRAVAIAAHFLEELFPDVLTRLELHLGPDGLVSCDTGHTWPLRGKYRLEGGRLYGSFAGGQYFVRDDGRLFQGSVETGFYVANGRLYGPERRPPWVQTRAALAAQLETARAMEKPADERADAVRRFAAALFQSHGLGYQPIDDDAAGAVGIVTTADGAFLVGAHMGWGSGSVPAIRDFEAAAGARGIGALYMLLQGFDPAVYPLAPVSTIHPMVIVQRDELQRVVDGELLLIETLDKKIAGARAGRVYTFVP